MSNKKENAGSPATSNGIQEELAKLKAELKSTKLSLAGSKGAHELLSRKYKELQDKLTEIVEERNSFRGANQMLNQENVGLRNELAGVNQELVKSTKALDVMREQIDEALVEKKAKIEELEHVVAMLQQEVSDLHVRESLAKKPWWRRLF